MNIYKISKPIFWAFFILTISSFYACNGQTEEKSSNSKKDVKTSKVDSLLKADNIEIINPTFLNNEKRNYYGNEAPKRLDLIWKIPLGSGTTKVGSQVKTWSGAGWTGQSLLIKQDG